MTYFMQFDPSMKAIRPTDDTRLRMPTPSGDLEVGLYRAKFQEGGVLIGVRRTPENLAVLGLDPNTGAGSENSEWIVPPFKILSNAFAKGGPFIRDGKLDHTGFDPDSTVTNYGRYTPGIPGFVPSESDYALDVTDVDRSDWTMFVWLGGQAARLAGPEERSLPIVSRNLFSLGHLDLWLEQYRCFHLGLNIPTEFSPPDTDIDHDCDEHTTDSGMKTTVIALDESAGDDAGKSTMYAKVLVDSELDKAVATTEYEANGYFLEGLLKYWQTTGQADPELELDPEADGIGILGQPDHVRTAREKLNTLPTTAEEMQALVADIKAAGIDID